MRILDLDNCISDDEWRVPKIDHSLIGHARFHTYHSLAPWDTHKNRDLVTWDESITIMTARPVFYHGLTEGWLRRNNIPFRHLIMRNEMDHRPSVELKRTQLEWLIDYYECPLSAISIAYDDRSEIVDMYRSFGIRAEVRAIHNNVNYGTS